MKDCYLLEPAQAKNIDPRVLARGLGWLEPSQENFGSARLGSEKTGSRRPLINNNKVNNSSSSRYRVANPSERKKCPIFSEQMPQIQFLLHKDF